MEKINCDKTGDIIVAKSFDIIGFNWFILKYPEAIINIHVSNIKINKIGKLISLVRPKTSSPNLST